MPQTWFWVFSHAIVLCAWSLAISHTRCFKIASERFLIFRYPCFVHSLLTCSNVLLLIVGPHKAPWNCTWVFVHLHRLNLLTKMMLILMVLWFHHRFVPFLAISIWGWCRYWCLSLLAASIQIIFGRYFHILSLGFYCSCFLMPLLSCSPSGFSGKLPWKNHLCVLARLELLWTSYEW